MTKPNPTGDKLIEEEALAKACKLLMSKRGKEIVGKWIREYKLKGKNE